MALCSYFGQGSAGLRPFVEALIYWLNSQFKLCVHRPKGPMSLGINASGIQLVSQ